MTTDTAARLRRFARCKVLWVTILSIVVYVALSVTIPTQPLLEFVRIVAATTALVTAIAFSADAWDSITAEKPDKTDSIVIGIFLLAVCTFITNFWLLLYRLAERPEWMLNVLTFGFLSGWLTAIANLLHVWAPGVLRKSPDGGEVPPVRLRAVGIAAAIGVFAALVILASQPDAKWLVEGLRPWVH